VAGVAREDAEAVRAADRHLFDLSEQIENEGVKVLRYKAISSADELEKVNDTVQAFFVDRPHARRYVVSDCDIDMGVADVRAFDLYNELLDEFPQAECVGPMLRIRDIPLAYPLFNRVMNRHIEQFWYKSPSWIETTLGRVAYQEAMFDTTFALHRAGHSFRRFKNGLRVYEPYEALHLDWYVSSDETDAYSQTSSSNISHWNNAEERERYRNVALEFSQFIAVGPEQDGYKEYEVRVPADRE
jgi:hypothetical protein